MSSLEPINEFITEFAHDGAVGEEDVSALRFVIDEIFSNMVKYQPGSNIDVLISLTRGEGEITIRMIDHEVRHFDPTERPDADTAAPLEERRPGGLGIHLVRRMVDSFEYEYRDRNSIITLVKKTDSAGHRHV
jgi:anti-sigma regulatory factor (Ser/Thr protein kinase)